MPDEELLVATLAGPQGRVDIYEVTLSGGRTLDVEYAVVFGKHYYGTPRTEVAPYRANGVGVVLDIDVQGAEQLRTTCPDGFTIFLETPEGEFGRRLRERGTDSEEAIQRRLAEAREELARADEFDARLINDDIERAAEEFCAMIRARFRAAT